MELIIAIAGIVTLARFVVGRFDGVFVAWFDLDVQKSLFWLNIVVFAAWAVVVILAYTGGKSRRYVESGYSDV